MSDDRTLAGPSPPRPDGGPAARAGAADAEDERLVERVLAGERAGRLERALTVQAELVSVFFVPSGSMRPTLPTGARILVDRGAYRARPLCRGDVIVFPNPDQPHQLHVKRVLALPGDRVELRGDGVLVNGVRTPPPNGDRGGAVVDPNPGAGVSATVTVPHGHCFVMGDDRERSIGSREYGPVPIASVLGRVALVLSPRWQPVAGGDCAGELSAE